MGKNHRLRQRIDQKKWNIIKHRLIFNLVFRLLI